MYYLIVALIFVTKPNMNELNDRFYKLKFSFMNDMSQSNYSLVIFYYQIYRIPESPSEECDSFTSILPT